MDSVFQCFSFGSGTIPKNFQKKLKNCFFQGHSGRDSPYMDSVFQFLSFGSGTIPEYLRKN